MKIRINNYSDVWDVDRTMEEIAKSIKNSVIDLNSKDGNLIFWKNVWSVVEIK